MFINLPNSIFSDLQQSEIKVNHIPFAYAYYYLVSYLYYNCLHIKDDHTLFDVKCIKQALGLSPIYKKIDYIIKKEGLLDQIGYTESSTDYPLKKFYDEDGVINFQMLSDLKKDPLFSHINNKNFKIKFPVKAFYSCQEARDDDILDGHFYDFHNTHKLIFEEFTSIINNPKLGLLGFYLYGYFKMMHDKFDEYKITYSQIKDNIGIIQSTIEKYIKALVEENYLYISKENIFLNNGIRTFNIYSV